MLFFHRRPPRERGCAGLDAAPLSSGGRHGLDAAATEEEGERLLAAVGEGSSVLLHGEGSSCWSALTLAARRGLDTRIGLEDVEDAFHKMERGEVLRSVVVL